MIDRFHDEAPSEIPAILNQELKDRARFRACVMLGVLILVLALIACYLFGCSMPRSCNSPTCVLNRAATQPGGR